MSKGVDPPTELTKGEPLALVVEEVLLFMWGLARARLLPKSSTVLVERGLEVGRTPWGIQSTASRRSNEHDSDLRIS